MKSVVVLAGLLISSSSFAASFNACSAFYSAGIGHVLKGTATQLGDKEKVLSGQQSSDKLYTFSLSEENVPSLKETRTGKNVELKVVMNEGITIYGTDSLTVFPDYVPGAFAGRKFVVVMCADKNDF